MLYDSKAMTGRPIPAEEECLLPVHRPAPHAGLAGRFDGNVGAASSASCWETVPGVADGALRTAYPTGRRATRGRR
jgi:hypothetical protein